jgi:putative component of toxin-antitoxin plasmid stabilization module
MPNPVTRASFDLRVEHGPVYRVYFIERGEVVIDLLLPTVGGNWHAV